MYNVGDKFGQQEIVRIYDGTSGRYPTYILRCSCGTERVYAHSSLMQHMPRRCQKCVSARAKKLKKIDQAIPKRAYIKRQNITTKQDNTMTTEERYKAFLTEVSAIDPFIGLYFSQYIDFSEIIVVQMPKEAESFTQMAEKKRELWLPVLRKHFTGEVQFVVDTEKKEE